MRTCVILLLFCSHVTVRSLARKASRANKHLPLSNCKVDASQNFGLHTAYCQVVAAQSSHLILPHIMQTLHASRA